MDQEHLEKIIEENPHIDPTAIDRSRQAMKQLADAGIKLGGYRLKPALGGATIKCSDDGAERGSGDTQGAGGTQARPQNLPW